MGYTVLVVDDETDLQHLVRQNFRRKIRKGELEFHFAHDGYQALDTLQEVPDVDAVLTDINMPNMDGLTLIDNITSKYPHLRTVVVSAYGDMNNVRIAMNNGAFDFVTKPIDFTDLEITMNKTLVEVANLKKATEDRKKLQGLQKELEIGKRIQQNFLPEKIEEVSGFDIKAYSSAAKDVGGDFYDVFKMKQETKVCFVITDVCGKGVGAALFMALIRSLIRAFSLNFTGSDSDIVKKLVSSTHDYIIANHESSGMFATMFIGILDTESSVITYANVGHNPPVLVKADGTQEWLKPQGPALGIFPDLNPEPVSINFDTNDILFCYTDGVTEATSKTGELYNEERLEELLKNERGELDTIIQSLVDELTKFAEGIEQSDDITILALKKLA